MKVGTEPLVTAIVIFYNAETFIRDAIESVLAQTYENWELLLVDDGSTDDSAAIAQHYADERPKQVHYLQHPDGQNHGRSASRNVGIRHASGTYLALLDADDVWLPDKLRRQVDVLQSQPAAAMMYGRTERWYSWSGQPEDASRDYTPPLGVSSDALVPPPTLLKIFLRRQAPTPCPCSVLVRRDAVLRVGGFVDSFPGVYDDQVFYAKLCLNEPVYVSGLCLDRYRRHQGSGRVVARKNGQYLPERLAYLKWLADYLHDTGAKDSDLWTALRLETWRTVHPWLASRADRIVSLTRQTPLDPVLRMAGYAIARRRRD